MALALRNGFTGDEVRQGIASVLKYRKLMLAHDGVIASTWINYMQLGRDFVWWADMNKKLQSLPAAQVNSVMRATLKPGEFSTEMAADPAKSNPSQPHATASGQRRKRERQE